MVSVPGAPPRVLTEYHWYTAWMRPWHVPRWAKGASPPHGSCPANICGMTLWVAEVQHGGQQMVGGGERTQVRSRDAPSPVAATSAAHPQPRGTNTYRNTEAHAQAAPALPPHPPPAPRRKQRRACRDPVGAGVHRPRSPRLPQRHYSRPQLAGEGKVLRETSGERGVCGFVQKKSVSREGSRTTRLTAAAPRE